MTRVHVAVAAKAPKEHICDALVEATQETGEGTTILKSYKLQWQLALSELQSLAHIQVLCFQLTAPAHYSNYSLVAGAGTPPPSMRLER